jgi:DNA-binding NarL/FixJ family response regulator
MTTIAILDDHPLFRDGLRNLLVAEGLPVVAESANIAGVDALLAASPDLVIIDLGLPDGDGLDVVRRIRTTTPRTRVLVLSMASDAATVARALGAGAHGFLTKDSTPSEVVSAIRAVAAGSVVVGSSVAGRLHGLADHAAYTPTERDFPRLTARERQVLGLVADGLTNAEVATELGLSEKTVANYVSVALSTLHARDRNALSQIVRDASRDRQ